MKNLRFFLVNLCTLSSFLILLGCSTDDEINVSNVQEAINNAKSGIWYISNYVDSDENETNDYSDYDFTFNDDGSLTASNGINTITGSWSVTDDINSSVGEDIDFNISFASPSDFEELSDDWDIVSISTSKIDLIDISDDNGGTDDILTFEKK